MKIAMLISGGVDSSVALNRLVEEGCHDITAFYLKIWLEDEFQFLGECPWEEDLKYARSVCDKLGIPLKVIPLQSAYWDEVVAHVVEELKNGRTPSPDILCNQRVKFGAFCDYIDDSYDKIATGHYAQTIEEDAKTWLLKGNDPVKDQTYFLSNLSKKQLDRCLFPIGHLPKSEVRALAEKYNLPNKARKDSQGICFLGKIKYSEFVKVHLGEKEGDIVDKSTGTVLGKHKGFWFHTIGQRKGLGLHGGPWFVIDKDIPNNVVYVGGTMAVEQAPRKDFYVTSVNWLTEDVESGSELTVKIRHGERVTPCTVTKASDDRYLVNMTVADGGIAAGQYGVFYKGERCLGCGVITN